MAKRSSRLELIKIYKAYLLPYPLRGSGHPIPPVGVPPPYGYHPPIGGGGGRGTGIKYELFLFFMYELKKIDI